MNYTINMEYRKPDICKTEKVEKKKFLEGNPKFS